MGKKVVGAFNTRINMFLSIKSDHCIGWANPVTEITEKTQKVSLANEFIIA